MKKVQISFTKQALDEANARRTERGLPTIDEGPLFEQVAECMLTGNWVCIRLNDGTEYAYSANSVARVKEF